MLWRNLTLTTWHFLSICNDEWWINPLDLVENIYLRWMNHYFSHDTFHCIKIYIKALDNYHSVYTSKSDFEIWGNLWGPYHWNFTNLRNFYAIFYFIDQPLSKENALEWKKMKGCVIKHLWYIYATRVGWDKVKKSSTMRDHKENFKVWKNHTNEFNSQSLVH